MSQTYKLNHVIGDYIKHIYILSNDVKAPEYNDLNDNPIFSEEEMQNINDGKIPVTIIPAVLHGDDTIGMIKKKIVHALELENSTKEVYLFGIVAGFIV